MRLPILTFLVTFFAFTIVGLHSVWRFVVREQLPSLVHAGTTACATYAAWLAFQGTVAGDPMTAAPSMPSVVLMLWSAASVLGIHFYELGQRNHDGIPYDGLFPWWR